MKHRQHVRSSRPNDDVTIHITSMIAQLQGRGTGSALDTSVTYTRSRGDVGWNELCSADVGLLWRFRKCLRRGFCGLRGLRLRFRLLWFILVWEVLWHKVSSRHATSATALDALVHHNILVDILILVTPYAEDNSLQIVRFACI